VGERLGDALIAYLDTHAAVWLAEGTLVRHSRRAGGIVSKADLLLSPMALLELEYLYELKRSKLQAREVLLKLEHEAGVRVCDLPFPQISMVAVDEKWTRDPFDRVIVAQAKANGWAALVSADETIANHYARTVW
jgi:PIN domain nuclease of toxin-antitoxin system